MSSAHRPGGPEADPPPAESPTSTGETLARDPAQPAPGAAHRLAPGVVLAARFRIVSLLGRGGMGEVYRAEDLKLGQAVALKFLPDPIDQAKLRRFYDEVRLGRQVAHPNVCRIYDVIEAEARHFLVMEYVDGEDLASLLRRIGRLPQDKGLEIARGLCAGLAAAHEKGILHRDLKPANVMIDGRGQSRITDFGLAALAGETRGDERAGTPAYMAPEQLSGEEVTLRTDVYALGLVLYEIFTGRRAWDAESMPELLKRRSDSSPTTPSSLVPELDRGVERVIMSCLAREPSARPRTALAVLAALPGGDPLQAALALGETPSPEMVAAASVAGDLSAKAAWSWLAAAVVILVGLLLLAERVMLHRLVPLPKSPEVLLDRARTIAARLAPAERIVNSAWGLEVDRDSLRRIADRDASPDRWRRLATERPGPLLFWYRASREPLVARTWAPRPPWMLAVRPVGRVTRQHPAPTLPGMQEIMLDPSGRLVRWQRVPSYSHAPDTDIQATLGWLFAEAGLEEQKLKRFAFRSPLSKDDLHWFGRIPGAAGDVRSVSVDASVTDRGVTLFAVDAGTSAYPTSFARTSSDATVGIALRVLLLFVLILAVPSAALIIRNLRRKRGDLRGAVRIGLFGFATGAVALKLVAHFPPSIYDAIDLWSAGDAQAVYWAALGFVYYLALEPELRRTWPHTLISWSRLLSGRLRDPLVGRDVLLGVVAGGLLLGLGFGNDLIPGLWGAPQATPFVPVALASNREALAVLLQWPYPAALVGSACLLALLVFFRLTGSRRMALFLLWLLIFMLNMAGAEDLIGWAIFASLASLLVVGVLFHVGLLAFAVMQYLAWSLPNLPLTLDTTAWYAGSSALGLAVFGAMAVYGFVISLAGKPLLGRPSIED